MERQLAMLQPLLDIPYIRRVRRNHGLEHATIHMMSRKIRDLRIVGRSDASGFWLIGDVTTDQVESAVSEALERMRGGDHKLAIHPNCGTNLVTVAMLGTAATGVALLGADRERGGVFSRLPLIAIGIMFATLFGQPLGRQLQEHLTTLGDPGDLQVLDIKAATRAGMPAFRVSTTSS